MKVFRPFACALLFFFILTSLAGTATSLPAFRYRVSTSGYYPASANVQNNLSPGGALKGALDYQLSSKFIIGGTLGVGIFLTVQPNVNEYVQYLPFTMNLGFNALKKASWRFDLVGGPGIFAILNLDPKRPLSSIGAHLGGRFTFRLNPKMDLILELTGQEWLEEGFGWVGSTEVAEISLGISLPSFTSPVEGRKKYAEVEKAEPESALHPETLTKDSDNDGVSDELDRSPGTPPGVVVDEVGRPLDSDMDGAPDYIDLGQNTPLGIAVDSRGRPYDADRDGVMDYLDRHPNTPEGVSVDQFGRPPDADNDGIPDYRDLEPDTPAGMPVSASGVAFIKLSEGVLANVNFLPGKNAFTFDSYPNLLRLCLALKYNPAVAVELIGYSDSSGKPEDNLKLTQAQADAVKDYLVSHGIGPERITAKGLGASNFIAQVTTAPENRRIEVKIVGK